MIDIPWLLRTSEQCTLGHKYKIRVGRRSYTQFTNGATYTENKITPFRGKKILSEIRTHVLKGA
jgi:hypothetical protein